MAIGDLIRLSSKGKELIHLEVNVIHESGHAVRAGEVEEIVVRGETIMKGYWKRSEERRER